MTTTEEVIRLTREAGLHVITNGDCEVEDIARLIKLVKAEENEACAKDAHEFWIRNTDTSPAEAIRARRNKMADITMCENWKCPSSKNCYRYQAEPHPFWQCYVKFEPIDGDVRCLDYIPCTEEDEWSSL